MRWWVASLGALVLTACGGRRGPVDMERMLTPLTVEPPPIYAVIGARSDLELTSRQVASLDSIAVAIQAMNRPLIEELQSVSPAARTGVRRVTDEGEPILDQIRANSRKASEGVHALLTEDQRTEVCTLFDRSDNGGRNSEGRRGPGAPPAAPRDSAMANRPGFGPRWYWCSTAAPEPPATQTSAR